MRHSSAEASEKAPINWATVLFLVGSFLLAAVGTPLYAWRFGVTSFDIWHFVVMCYATGLAITIGYHRLFAHRSFEGARVVKIVAGLFGAATFENSILCWSSEHRYHHSYVDQDGFPYDPYNISKGFLHAHMGWLFRKMRPELPRSNVKDLAKDPFLVWQDRHIMALMIVMGFGLPTLIGLLHATWVGASLVQGALAGFLFGGALRIVCVQHATFFINSLAHTLGRQPYDSEGTARDSGIVAFFTFGEGYHNFHHTFQADYRNGIRPWHFDPGKWVIFLLERTGLAWDLKKLPAETINLARVKERRRRLEKTYSIKLAELRLQAVELMTLIESSLDEVNAKVRRLWKEYRQVKAQRSADRRVKLREIRHELRRLRREFRLQLRTWEDARAWALVQVAAS